LLADIRDVFVLSCESFMASRMLVKELRDIEDSPWGDDELTVSRLARLLKPYGVKPKHNPAKTVRGYDLASLNDAFRRYLRPEASNRPKPGPEQDEQPETETVPNPSTTRPPDTSGRLADTSDNSPEPGVAAAQDTVPDGRTGWDDTPAGTGPTGTGGR
jgi:hypothetical protein